MKKVNGYKLYKLADPVTVTFNKLEVKWYDGVIDSGKDFNKLKGFDKIMSKMFDKLGPWFNWFDRVTYQDVFGEVADFDGDYKEFDRFERICTLKYSKGFFIDNKRGNK